MKLAVAMIPESGRVSPVFEAAGHVTMLRLCHGELTKLAERALPETETEKIAFLQAHGVRLLICGAVCNATVHALTELGIRVCPFVSGDWQAAVEAWRTGRGEFPPAFIMPGCGRHHRQCCRSRRRGRGDNDRRQT